MSMMQFMRLTVALSCVLLCLPTRALARDQSELLKASAALQFERDGMEVFANFDLEFTNTTGKAICVRVGQIPGSDDFDPGLVEIRGPKGVLPIEDSDAARRRHFPDIDTMGLRFVAFLRGATVRVGRRISKDDYIFKDAGFYRAVLRIEAYDCAKLDEISSVSDTREGWFLGFIVAEASATLQ